MASSAPEQELAGDLRARVIGALEAAGFRHREDHLPTRTSGGTFSVIGSDRSGVNVTADWWDVPPAQLEELYRRLRAALRLAGFPARTYPERIYVPPPEDKYPQATA